MFTELQKATGTAIPHTNALFIRALDTEANERTLALLYTQSDNWFGNAGYLYEEELHRYLIRMLHSDKTVKGYQTNGLRLVNGIYRQVREYEPTIIR